MKPPRRLSDELCSTPTPSILALCGTVVRRSLIEVIPVGRHTRPIGRRTQDSQVIETVRANSTPGM